MESYRCHRVVEGHKGLLRDPSVDASQGPVFLSHTHFLMRYRTLLIISVQTLGSKCELSVVTAWSQDLGGWEAGESEAQDCLPPSLH